MRGRIRLAAVAGSLGLGLLFTGCAGGLGLLDPEFLADLGRGTSIASLPGDAPALLVAVQNLTEWPVRAVLSYRTQDANVETRSFVVEAGEQTAQALICPVEEITLGDVADVSAIGAVVVFGSGVGFDEVAPYIEVEPFGVVMTEAVNYDCGDSITFVVQPSGATTSGYQVFAFVRRSGE